MQAVQQAAFLGKTYATAMSELTHIEDGRAAVFKREGTYHARIRVDGKYVYRSLKTGDLEQAKKAAQKLVHKFEFSAENGIPISAKKFSDVIDEYVEYRERENEHGRTSDGMLRQIQRVVRFWHAYAGDKLISAIGDKELRDYIQWRRDYYTRRPNEAAKRNVKPNPTDKTLQFDLMIGKAIIAWANERGYRGKLPLPTYTFTPKKKRVRPAFEQSDIRRLLAKLEEWIEQCEIPKYRETRLLLRDYITILAWSGMRVGEANNLRIRDVHKFTDHEDRVNYRFVVRGKTGERDVIPFASAAYTVEDRLKRLADREPNDWFFAMPGGSKITSLADQFRALLEFARVRVSADGEAFSLYSLRHHYAVRALRTFEIGIYDVARNMGTSVQMIEQYYGKHATPQVLATKLGGRVKEKHKFKSSAE